MATISQLQAALATAQQAAQASNTAEWDHPATLQARLDLANAHLTGSDGQADDLEIARLNERLSYLSRVTHDGALRQPPTSNR